jgi:hypothetical protein
VLWGSQYIIPVERDKFFQRVYPGKVWAIVSDPIFPDQYKNMNVDELSNFIRKIMEEKIEFLKQKELEELKNSNK